MEAADDRRTDGTPNRDPRWRGSGYFYSTAGHTEKVVGRIPMSRDAFPTRELSLSGSSRCSSQPPSTRRVGSGKLHSTHAWSSEWVGMGWRGRRDYSEAQGIQRRGLGRTILFLAPRALCRPHAEVRNERLALQLGTRGWRGVLGAEPLRDGPALVGEAV
eukprot:scaffold17931_cov59-Phaeocystis_antarctica.AAC.3